MKGGRIERRWRDRALRFLLISLGMYGLTVCVVVLWLWSKVPFWIADEFGGKGCDVLVDGLSGIYTFAWLTGVNFHILGENQGRIMDVLVAIGYQWSTVAVISWLALKVSKLTSRPKLVFATVYFLLFWIVVYLTTFLTGPLFSPVGSNVRY